MVTTSYSRGQNLMSLDIDVSMFAPVIEPVIKQARNVDSNGTKTRKTFDYEAIVGSLPVVTVDDVMGWDFSQFMAESKLLLKAGSVNYDEWITAYVTSLVIQVAEAYRNDQFVPARKRDFDTVREQVRAKLCAAEPTRREVESASATLPLDHKTMALWPKFILDAGVSAGKSGDTLPSKPLWSEPVRWIPFVQGWLR